MDQISVMHQEFLTAEQRAGRLSADAKPDELAEYVMTLLQGLRVRSRTSSKPIDFCRAIAIAMGPIKEAEQTHTNTTSRVH